MTSRSFSKCIIIFIYLFLSILTNAIAVPEHELKVAYLYNLMHFITWPNIASSSQKSFYFCILEREHFQDIINTLLLLKDKDRNESIEVFHLKKPEEVITTYPCNILFIGSSEKDNYLNILAISSLYPILTVGETDGFAKLGGMVEFYAQDNKFRLRLNVAIMKWAQLKASTQLKKVSQIIDSYSSSPFLQPPSEPLQQTPQPSLIFTPYISKTANDKKENQSPIVSDSLKSFLLDPERFYAKSQLNQWVKESIDLIIICLQIMLGISTGIVIFLLVKIIT